MPDNPTSLYDQLAPLVQQQQEVYKQRADALDQMLSPYADRDPVNMAYVSGLLAPTKSGSFFESLGNAVNSERGVLSKLRQDQMDQQDKIRNLQAAQIRLAMEAPVRQAQADYWRNRAAGGATNRPLDVQKTIDNIRKLETDANAAETRNDLPTAQRLRAYAEKLRTDLMGAGATDVSGQEPDVSAQEEQQSGGLWDTLSEIAGAASTIGQGEKGTTQGTSIGLGGAPTGVQSGPEDEEAPAAAEGESEKAAKPQTTAAPSNIYKGNTPPKEFPNARKGTDGGWYVVKDGKPYPVLK